MKKLTSLIIVLSATLTAHAEGIKVTYDCRSTPGAKTSISLKMTDTVSYSTRKRSFDVEYSGNMSWDVNPFEVSGKVQFALPDITSKNNSNEFAAKNDKHEMKSVLLKDSNKLSLNILSTRIKVPIVETSQILLLSLASNNLTGAAFGNLYITDENETQSTTPDGGPSVSLLCQRIVNDI